MKKLMVALTCVLFGSPVFAATNSYDLEIDLAMNGKHVSSPRILVNEGETASATVTQKKKGKKKKTFLEVVATEKDPESDAGILMKFVVGYIGKNGKKEIVSTPEIIATEGQPAEIAIGGAEGNDEVMLRVTAVRKTL